MRGVPLSLPLYYYIVCEREEHYCARMRARAHKGWCRVCYGAAEMKHHKHNVSQLLAAANPGRKRSEASS